MCLARPSIGSSLKGCILNNLRQFAQKRKISDVPREEEKGAPTFSKYGKRKEKAVEQSPCLERKHGWSVDISCASYSGTQITMDNSS
jgi:hypothetical protein